MLDILLYTVFVLLAVWIAIRLFLRGPDLSTFDEARGESPGNRVEASKENREVLRLLADIQARLRDVPRREQMKTMRQIMDEGFTGAPVGPDELGVTIETADAGGVPAEWVMAPGADAGSRLLYLHGGGFYVGSPLSHRMLTSALSKSCGVTVLAIDYRLMPENRRIDSIVDSQAAYRWMLENGPSGQSAARQVFVAGDSAGGNLALMLSAWVRDEGLQAIDGVIAFSPSTDSTLANPSTTENIKSDAMLGPALGPVARLPVAIKTLIALAGARMNPRNPLVSPLFGDLSNLPPTLVQASESEMLRDDGRRYVNKARGQGSPATLQTWPGMVHVFQMFLDVLPEAVEALDEVARFVAEITGNEAQAEPSAQTG